MSDSRRSFIARRESPTHLFSLHTPDSPLFVDGDSALYTQRNNSHVELPAEGNGIKIYRPANAGDPGAFDAASANYQQVDKDYVDSRKTGLLSHIDFEVATGLGARQRMKLGTSHALWECDPNTNDHCNLAANFQGEHRYAPLPRST